MASGVFPENLRKSNEKPMCYNQTKFVKNELYMERFHGNGLKKPEFRRYFKNNPTKKKIRVYRMA